MGGFFGAASREDCVFDVFYGTDYHSHLGTRRAGLAFYHPDHGFDKAIHNIESSPFRSKFFSEFNSMHGILGIGCISDFEAQPIFIRSHHGSFAITTVGKINNSAEIVSEILDSKTHFFEMQNGEINQTELVAALINRKDNFIEGIRYAQQVIDGSISMLILTTAGIYVARDRLGRTPISVGRKDDGSFCASFESFAFLNLGYKHYKDLGPGEIDVINLDSCVTLVAPGTDRKICAFLYVYYGYPSSCYEGISVESMRYRCGALQAKRDRQSGDPTPDIVAGVPDSGMACAIGYAGESHIPYARPFIKYTPTWARSFMPPSQAKRDLIARMKLIPIHDLIEDKSLLLFDDSIVRGTQLRETTDFLYESGAKEVHIRLGCPPILFRCRYLNFSRSGSDLDLITRRVIFELEGGDPPSEILAEYADPDSERYAAMVEKIRQIMHFTTLRYPRIDDLIEAIGLPADQVCTYCWNGKG